MRLSPSLADQGRSGYHRGSASCSSFLGTAICGSRLSVHAPTRGTAVSAMAAAATVVRREGGSFRFIGEIVPEVEGRRKFAAQGRGSRPAFAPPSPERRPARPHVRPTPMPPDPALAGKLTRLRARMRELGSVLVCYSG